MECKVRNGNKIQEHTDDLDSDDPLSGAGKDAEDNVRREVDEEIQPGECDDKRNEQGDQSQPGVHVDQRDSAGKGGRRVSGGEGGSKGPLDEKRDVLVDIAGAFPIKKRFKNNVAGEGTQKQSNQHIQAVAAGAGIENQASAQNRPEETAVSHDGKGQHGNAQRFGLIALHREQERFIKTP